MVQVVESIENKGRKIMVTESTKMTTICHVSHAVMLVLDLGLGLGFEVWPWQKIQGQNLGRLQNSPLTSTDWSTVTGVNYISRSTFLNYLQWAIVAL